MVDELVEPIEIEEETPEVEATVIENQLEAYHAMVNIAENLEPDVISTLGAKVIEGYNTDKNSRVEWEKANKEIMDLAKLESKKKTYAGEQVANVKYPLITGAAIQFAARSYPEIIKGTEVVKAKIIGEDKNGLKAKRGGRVATHMSYQLLNDMPDWEDGVDQLLFTLPIVGCAFKKSYYFQIEQANISEMVFPDDLVVHYNAVSLEKASRITHIIELTQNEIVERIRSDVFLDFDVEELGTPTDTKQDDTDEDTPHRFLEQHRWYDLDDDGYQEPYICTVHEGTQKLVRISARFDLAGVQRNDKDEIIRIEPTHYFTRFLFMPAPDGCFYGMGFGSLLHSINSSANTVLNQLLDSGTIHNRQSGFLGKGLKLGRGASLKFKSGEWKQVNVTGADLKANIVPLHTKEPSNVLFQLLGLLIETGKELSGITEVLSGQSPGANVPAETTLALIEQGLQVYTAINKRVHRSLYQEYKKLRRLNLFYTTPEQYNIILDDPDADFDNDYNSTDHDIIPVSDPNATTNMQRIMKAKAMLEMRGQGLNDEEINKRYLKALQIEDIDELFPDKENQEPDPVQELEILSAQADIENKVAESGKVAAETQLITEKINTEKVIQETKIQGVGFDQQKLKIEEAQTINSIKNISDRNKIDAATLVKEIRDSKFEGKTAETNTQGSYRERGLTSNNKEV